MRVEVIDRDPRIGFTLVRGSSGERWVPDMDRRGWGLRTAYSRWSPETEVKRLRAIARYKECADCWMHGDVKGMVKAMSGPGPLVALDGGKTDG